MARRSSSDNNGSTAAKIAAHSHVLTISRYDGTPFEEKTPRLVAELGARFADSVKLETQIRDNLKGLVYGG